ncbi:MAG: ClpXP protease specificity-enhancing factor, partial [Betaproteobacteria bacterium]|nr:ClpXP protease specificity-enhancing factor [Betaproteobacteria bacterium]
MSSHSTKPYLIRAIHEWCSDQGHTPYLAVAVDEHTIVPMEYVKGGEIVLNVSLAATNRLRLGNDWIEFQARFGGVARDISIPISHVSAIYARETGHGMAFEVSKPQALLSAVDLSKSQAALPSPDEAHPQVGTGSPVSRAP